MEDHPQGRAGPQTPDLRATRRLFFRLLALVYFFAFLSLALQVEGLFGSQGILPARDLLEWVKGSYGRQGYFLLPTLFWLQASDTSLLLLCWGGVALSALLFAGLWPLPVLSLLWVFYLSLVSVGRVFLGYQWDALLLETGLFSILLAPSGFRLRREGESAPPPLSVWLCRFLLFRLMFASGAVKLLSADPTWRSLEALKVHFETQPLPTPIGWYAHQLPAPILSFGTALTFVIELGAPFLVFLGRRARLAAAGSFVLLQLLIATTGNYCFFNLLTIALCVLLLDDTLLPRRLRGEDLPQKAPLWLYWPQTAAAGFFLALSVVVFTQNLGLGIAWPSAVLAVERAAGPFRSVNAYGLFAVMTTSREEIEVEGSTDGKSWKPYSFRFKPGDVLRRPSFVAPFQPRLDWQMWFAALGRCDSNPWFLRFVDRLLEGSPPVLGLLDKNPFPDAPPTLIRTTLWDYRFTRIGDPDSRAGWWRRQEVGPYCPLLGSR